MSALSWNFDLLDAASGKGRVHTTTVVRRKPERGGDYNVCMVELEEGVRMMSRVDGIARRCCNRHGGDRFVMMPRHPDCAFQTGGGIAYDQ